MSDESKGTKPKPVKPGEITGSVAPPEPKQSCTLRLYKSDYELLHELYPDGIGEPVRRLVRRFADSRRTKNGEEPRGFPMERKFGQ